MANKKYGLTIGDLELGKFYVFYKIKINNAVYEKIVGKIKDIDYSGYRKIGVSFINIEDNPITSNGLYYFYWINPQFERIDTVWCDSRRELNYIGKKCKIVKTTLFSKITTLGTITDYFIKEDDEIFEVTFKNGSSSFLKWEDFEIIEENNQENNQENKEEIMYILEIYKNKQTKIILEEANKRRNNATEEDEEYSKVTEMCNKYDITMPSTDNFKEVTAKLDKIKNEEDLELDKLNDLLSEVEAQLDLCETYEQKVGVLKTYDILDDNGKVRG